MEVLKAVVWIIMLGCFFAQMRELFHQFISELKTVAVSFKDEKEVEFPTLAFCDSTAFTQKIGITSNVTLYNASTYSLEEDISLHSMSATYSPIYSAKSFPTTHNGYCKLYEFYGKYDFNTIMGK